MTWHMVEHYGQPSPGECMGQLLGETAVNLRALSADPELTDLQKTEGAIRCLSRVASLSYLLRSGWPKATYRAFRDPLLEHLNDFDRVRAARVIEVTLGEHAPAQWQLNQALPQATTWLDAVLPDLLRGLLPPTSESVTTALTTLASHCLEPRPWLRAHGPSPSGARLAKLLRQARRLQVFLELFSPGLSEQWQTLHPSLVAWVDCLERWTQVRRVARTVRRSGSEKSQARLRRSERRLASQTIAATAALQLQPRVPLVIDWFQVVQECLGRHVRIRTRTQDL
jgi:hypothetical protein